MKIIVGIDISKATIDAFMTGGKARSFANSRAGFGQLLKWSKGAELYVMEATGAYHFALADHLHGAGQKISVVNPRMASHYAKALGLCHKTDQVDARVLALYAERNDVPSYVPESAHLRRLKKLARHRERMVADSSGLKRLLKGPELDDFEASQLKARLKFIKAQITKLEQEIYRLIADHEELSRSFALLLTIPGLGAITGLCLLAEAGDMGRFGSAKQLASFAGVHPKLRQSGTSLRCRPRMSKLGSSSLRKALYMSALAAARHEGPCRSLFLRLIERGHSRMSALGAVMHKQLRIAFGVCSGKRPFSLERTGLTTQ